MTLEHEGDIRDALMGINDSLKALVDVLSRTVNTHPHPRSNYRPQVIASPCMLLVI
jgi:hypothetical protein